MFFMACLMAIMDIEYRYGSLLHPKCLQDTSLSLTSGLRQIDFHFLISYQGYQTFQIFKI